MDDILSYSENKTRLVAIDATGGFIEQESFKDFLYM